MSAASLSRLLMIATIGFAARVSRGSRNSLDAAVDRLTYFTKAAWATASRFDN
jgi:hypothetical protein